MRDKDYRGKNVHEKWCFGSLMTTDFGPLIVPDEVSLNDFEFGEYDYVHPETIGEFVTCNKEGQRLYTDDLFRYRLGHIVQLIWDEKEKRYIGHHVGSLNTNFSMSLVVEMKLIGNIHDNPELFNPKHDGYLMFCNKSKTNEEEK